MGLAERSRTVNAVLQFAAARQPLDGKSLFLGLYLLDVTHIQETGRTCTGLAYAAGDFGPYPLSLSSELGDGLGADLSACVRVERVAGSDHGNLIIPLVDAHPDFDHFTPRQERTLGWVVDRIRESPNGRIDIAMFDQGAWQRALGKRKHTIIDLSDAIDRSGKLAVELLARRELQVGRAEMNARRIVY